MSPKPLSTLVAALVLMTGSCAPAGDSDDTGDTGDTGESCPPQAVTIDTPCGREAANMLCCGMFGDPDPPSWQQICEDEYSALAGDPGTEHCVALADALLGCTAALPCDLLVPYGVASTMGLNPGQAQPSHFDGLACGDEAGALLDAGCPLLTTATDP